VGQDGERYIADLGKREVEYFCKRGWTGFADLPVTGQVRVGSIASVCLPAGYFRSAPINGHHLTSPVGPFRAISGHASSVLSSNLRLVLSCSLGRTEVVLSVRFARGWDAGTSRRRKIPLLEARDFEVTIDHATCLMAKNRELVSPPGA
jgi:hypothetical protein